MNYIYDVTLNLNKKLYEFYEWKEEDNPEFILKIPVYKVDLETFLDMKYNDVIISKKILDEIEDKTESYSPNSIDIIRYACVFVCDESTIAIEFDSSGNNYMKSSILLDEENEILDMINNIKYKVFDYKVKKTFKKAKRLLTRNEENLQKNMIKKIDNIYKNKEYSKLKYIFFEIYNEKTDDINKVYDKLMNVLLNADEKTKKLNNILNLIEYRKIMSNNS